MKISPWIGPALGMAYVTGYLKLYLMSLLFITIHELAHGAAALWSGRRIREISIGPAGAQLWIRERSMDRRPQFLLHMAGPLINGILALGFAWGFLISIREGGAAELNRELWRSGCLINCILAMFNLLPLYPLDGGKLVLEILSSRMEPARAFRILYIFSCFFAVFIFLLGIYLVQYNLVNFTLCIVSVLSWKQLQSDRQYMTIRRVLESQL